MGESVTPSGEFDTGSFDRSYVVGEDFYRYVNAAWLAANPIPPEYGSWGAFHEVHVRNEELLRTLLDAAAKAEAPKGAERMVGDYWAAGLDEAGIAAAGLAPLEPLLGAIDTLEHIDDLTRVAATLRDAGIGVLFGAYVSPDFEDSSRYLLYVGQGGLGLPERDYYFRADEHSTELRTAYVAHVARMLELLGHDDDPEGAAAAIMDLESALAELSFTPAQLRDTELTTNKVATAELATAMPGFDLGTYLSRVVSTPPPTLNLDNPGFFSGAGDALRSAGPATLRAYLRWNLISATASSLQDEFVMESFDFYGRRLGGQRELKPRWKRVLAAASADIGQQVGKLYVAATFGAEAKARCEHMVDGLLVAMESSIRHLDWMGDATKQQALAKLAGFSYKIGYPDVWRDYTGLEIDRGPYVSNRLRAAAFEFRRKIAKLDGPVDPNEWHMEPHAVNAYYHPLYNEIVFPAGILQPPFFWADADDATNFGAIGSIIGHEITHGFDDQGSKFDAAGNLVNWWQEEDRAAFEGRAADLVDQYSDYEPVAGVAVNGELTLGENIADLGGLAIAYAALRTAVEERGDSMDAIGPDGLSAAQRFFVSYATIWRGNYTDELMRLLVAADPHAPNEYRCNGVLRNFPAFARAFSVDESAPLAAHDPVEIW